MVHLKDLREGNFVIHNENVREFLRTEFKDIKMFTPIKVDREIYLDLLCEPHPDHYDYIPITNLLLIKLGFTHEYNRKIYKSYPVFSILSDYCKLMYSCERLFKPYYNSFIPITQTPIKYLHQLQNIFYDLNGFELMDFVAFNYYKKIHKELRGFDGSYEFDSFLLKSKSDKKATSICEHKPEYCLGDLPTDLFQ